MLQSLITSDKRLFMVVYDGRIVAENRSYVDHKAGATESARDRFGFNSQEIHQSLKSTNRYRGKT